MRKVKLFIGLALSLMLANQLLIAQSIVNQNSKASKDIELPKTKEKAIKTYFQKNSIEASSSQATMLELDKSIEPSKLATLKSKLWAIWQKVNMPYLKKTNFGKYNELNKLNPSTWAITKGQVMPYSLLIKEDIPTDGYPFLINLHGGGCDPNAKGPWTTDMNNGEYKAACYLAGKYAQGEPSYYFIPRMADDRKGRWYLAPQIYAFKKAVKCAFLTGYINPYRTYLLGISEGGYGSGRLALCMPDYFAGIGPMAGAEPVKHVGNLRNVAFYMEVGENDTAYKRNIYAKDWQVATDKARRENPNDFRGKVTIQAGKGHGVNYYVTVPNLLKERRRTYPERLTYTYFNLTPDYSEKNYSTGVYYLDFRELKDNDGELALDIKKSGNSYRITYKNDKVSGRFGLYLDKIDFTKPVLVYVNGRLVYNHICQPKLSAMLSSLTLWGDPLRIFPSKLEIAL